MPLKLIHGPPNSGRAGLIRRRFVGRARARPGPGRADRRRRLRLRARALRGGRGAGRLGDDLRGAVPHRRHRRRGAAGRRALRRPAAAGDRGRGRRRGCARLGPLRRSAARPGFARAFERLLDELQAAGVEPGGGRGERRDPRGLRLPERHRHPLRRLRRGARAQPAGSTRTGSPARRSRCCARDGAFWGERPVFLYGLDDLTPNQFELVAALAALTEVTVALPFEEGNAALAARVAAARASCASGSARPRRPRPRPTRRTPRAPCSSTSPAASAPPAAGDRSPTRTCPAALGRRARRGGGDRRRGLEAARRRRRPGRRSRSPCATRRGAGRRSPRRWRPTGSPTALEAELPVAGTAVGGALVALLEAEFGTRPGQPTCCATCAAPRASPRAGSTGWSGRCGAAGSRTRTTALALWQGEEGEPPRDLVRLREAAARSPAALAAEVGRLAATMASRPLRGEGDGPALGPGDGLELRAAGAIAERARRARRAGRAGAGRRRSWRRRSPGSSSASGAARSRAGCGSPAPTACAPAASTTSSSARCRTASSRAATAAATPSSPKPSASSLGLDPRRDSEAEERYLFGVCLSLPRRRLFLSYRDSDENGGAEARSPLLDEVRALLAPAPDGSSPDPVEEAITRSRDLARRRPPARRGALRGRAGAGAGRARAGRRRRGRCWRAVGVDGERARPARRADRRRPPRRGRLAGARAR